MPPDLMEVNLSDIPDDPLNLIKFLKKNVEVITNLKVYTGKVFTIDPETKTIVLTTKSDQGVIIQVVMGQSVKSINILSDGDSDDIYEAEVSKEQCLIQKAQLVTKLNMHRIPFVEENEIIIIENKLFIRPPYGIKNCATNNASVFDRIRHLLFDK